MRSLCIHPTRAVLQAPVHPPAGEPDGNTQIRTAAVQASMRAPSPVRSAEAAVPPLAARPPWPVRRPSRLRDPAERAAIQEVRVRRLVETKQTLASWHLLVDMWRQGLPISPRALGAPVEICLALGQDEAAREWLERIVADLGQLPPAHLYVRTLERLLGFHCAYDRASWLARLQPGGSYDQARECLRSWLHWGASRQGDAIHHFLPTFIVSLCEADRAAEAKDTLELAASYGLRPQDDRIRGIVEHFVQRPQA